MIKHTCGHVERLYAGMNYILWGAAIFRVGGLSRGSNITIPKVTFHFRAQGQYRLSARDTPTHARLFEPPLHNDLVRAFDRAAPDKISLFLVFGIIDFVLVVR